MTYLQCFFASLVLVVSCFSDLVNAQTSTSSFKKFSNYSCRAKQKNVFLFFKGDTVNFKFKQLGLVEVSGKIGDNDQELLDRFKYTAYLNCANAVINIQTETADKNYGGDFRTDTRTYISRTYRGVAVRIESDSLYKSNRFGNSQDLSFLKNMISYNHEHHKKTVRTTVLAVLVAALLVGIYVLTAYR